MDEFDTKRLPVERDVVALDGSDVRILLQLDGGSLAHFELGPDRTSAAVAHRTVEEIWFFLKGHGEMWRKQDEREEIVSVGPGVCITIPVGTHFQFRCLETSRLQRSASRCRRGRAKKKLIESRGGGRPRSDLQGDSLVIIYFTK